MIEKIENNNENEQVKLVQNQDKKMNEYQFVLVAAKEARRLNKFPDDLKKRFVKKEDSIVDIAIGRVKDGDLDFSRNPY